MSQRYTLNANKQIGFTKILSYHQFCNGRKQRIQDYLIHLFSTTDTGLSCRQISDISGIWVQSLTNPLKILVESKKLDIVGFQKSSVSNRLVQLYGISVTTKPLGYDGE